jgi:hypothetical protein
MDFQDLNKASLKYGFLLPNIDMMVDSIARHDFLSFMHGFFRYNQIFINPQDQYKKTFTIVWRKFCWVMMLVRLKNVSPTYQRAMTLIFHDYIHKILEYYVDDILVKEIERQEHESSMDIILCPPIKINLDEKNITKIDEKVHNELNTLFSSSMSLFDESSTKSVELGDNPSMALDVIPLASFLPVTCYTEQDWEVDDLIIGSFARALLVLPLFIM